MKINFSTVLKDFRDGSEIVVPSLVADAPKKVITLGFVACEALLFPRQGEKESGAQIAAWKLAMRLHEGGEQEITPEEATLIKQCVVAAYPSPLITGQACQLLDG